MEKVNIAQKLSLFTEHWSPKIVGELNGQLVKLVKLKGEFVWHQHDHEDELFYVISGVLTMQFRDKTVMVNEGEFIIGRSDYFTVSATTFRVVYYVT